MRAYRTVHLTPEAREALAGARARLGGLAGRVVTLSATVEAALRVAEQHPEEWVAAVGVDGAEAPSA